MFKGTGTSCSSITPAKSNIAQISIVHPDPDPKLFASKYPDPELIPDPDPNLDSSPIQVKFCFQLTNTKL